MKRMFMVCVMVLAGLGGTDCLYGKQELPPGDGSLVQIGVYDSRAIAIAWAASKFNPVAERMKEFELAKQANDTARMTQLETWGRDHQRLLHVQGFGRVPVTDLLQPIRGEMQQLLRERRLVAIVMHCDVSAADVKIVDVTMDLVRCYDPSAQTLSWIEQLQGQDPLPLMELINLPGDR